MPTPTTSTTVTRKLPRYEPVPQGARWGRNSKAVRELTHWMNGHEERGEAVTAEMIVQWDLSHGRRLFTWSNDTAATQYRLHEARLLMNTMRHKINNMRVRSYMAVRVESETGKTKRAYVSSQTVSLNEGLREQVLADLTKRMKSLASELRLWKLTERERQRILDELREAIGLD